MTKGTSGQHHENVAPIEWRVGKVLIDLNEECQGAIEGPGTRDPELFAWRRLGTRIKEYCEEEGLSRPGQGRRGDNPKYRDTPLAASSYDQAIAAARKPSRKSKDVSLLAIGTLLDVLEHQCSRHRRVITPEQRKTWQYRFAQANFEDAMAEAADLGGRSAVRAQEARQKEIAVSRGHGSWVVIGPPEIRKEGDALIAEVLLENPEEQRVTASGMSADGDWAAIRTAIQAAIPNMEELENIRWYYMLHGQLTNAESRPTCQLTREGKSLTGRGQHSGSNRAAAEAIVDIVNQLLSSD